MIIYVLKLNQWKNTKEVIDWFASSDEKPLYKFVPFNKTESHPSIKGPLLEKALKFAEDTLTYQPKTRLLSNTLENLLLFNKSETWIKKDSGLFDIAKGPFDGAEVCELVGNFLLHKLPGKCKRRNLALYRVDGFAIFKNVNGPDSEKIFKKIVNCFVWGETG